MVTNNRLKMLLQILAHIMCVFHRRCADDVVSDCGLVGSGVIGPLAGEFVQLGMLNRALPQQE